MVAVKQDTNLFLSFPACGICRLRNSTDSVRGGGWRGGVGGGKYSGTEELARC